MSKSVNNAIYPLTPDLEKRIMYNPLLNIDTFIIPSPYIKDPEIVKDYEHSFVWKEEGELLGYMLTYADREKNTFLIYKVITSPFGRGRGIGTSLIEYLADLIPEGSSIYLYIWEKQADTMEFFTNIGFEAGETIVYRNLVYHHFSAPREKILKKKAAAEKSESVKEEIGKTRHDARKTVRLLSSMVDNLALENCGRIIEDINRETTTLVNILNSFRDSMETVHEVNLKDLIMERIIPFIEASEHKCEIRFSMESRVSTIYGSYVNIGRALVNIVSNSLEAIEETKNDGAITLKLYQDDEYVFLLAGDNGNGIEAKMLQKDEDGIPAFVGRTTKLRKQGEGLGTVQIFSSIGQENILICSLPGEGTTWRIRFRRKQRDQEKWFLRLERRYFEFRALWEIYNLTEKSDRNDVISLIWRVRKMEIFLFDLIMQFSKYHNMRDVYRTILSYQKNYMSEDDLRKTVGAYRSDKQVMNTWMIEISWEIKKLLVDLETKVNLSEYRGAMFKSYGQAFENIIIFTLDPESGNFLATDRKLAEHLDFAFYLGKDKNELLRGEFIGDMNNHDQPILFGVWSIESDEDLMKKLQMIREGARRLLEDGIHKDKKLAFYQTTYNHFEKDIDTDASTTFGVFAELSDEELKKFIRSSEDDEMNGFLVYRD